VRLVVTRPQPGADRTAAALRARGHAVLVAPLLRIEAIIDAEIAAGPFAAILATSANAAAAIARHKRFAELRALPVFAVGDHSAQAMRAVGFADVRSAHGDLHDLADLVAAQLKRSAALLYLAGAERAGDLAGALSSRGFAVKSAVIYRAVAESTFAPAARAALAAGIDGGIDGVLHFSRRSAEAYVNASRAASLGAAGLERPAHFCLSAQVAEPLARAGAAAVHIAAAPTEAALLALIPAA